MTALEYYRLHEDDRRAWAQEQSPACMVCGMCRATDIHEIERRGQAPRSWAHRCNYLFVCRFVCHSVALVNMPHAKQLAYKYLRDRANFDLESWNAIRKPPRHVTLAAVMAEVERMR